MTRWVMKFEVEADLGVESDQPSLSFAHPSGTYQVHFENQNMEPGCETPLLNAYVVFEEGEFDPSKSGPDRDVDSFKPISEAGEKHLTKFLYFLSFATGCRFRIGRRICLFDWTPGVARRHGIIYRKFPNPEFPVLALNQDLLTTIEKVIPSETDEELMQALRWFAAGVSSKPPDVQFQMFWFSIETMARHTRDPERVPDRCPQCREPLYCAKCQSTPTHRPYPSQMIQQLFARHVSDAPDLAYKYTSTMRHALLHGDRIARAEQESGFSLGNLVDLVARVAWLALFTALTHGAGLREEGVPNQTLKLVRPSTFLHFGVEATSRMSFSSPVDRDLQFSDLPEIKLELLVREFDEDEHYEEGEADE